MRTWSGTRPEIASPESGGVVRRSRTGAAFEPRTPPGASRATEAVGHIVVGQSELLRIGCRTACDHVTQLDLARSAEIVVVLVEAVLRFDLHTFEILLRHEVLDTRDGVRTVHDACWSANDFDAIEVVGREIREVERAAGVVQRHAINEHLHVVTLAAAREQEDAHLVHDGGVLGIELPNFIEARIVETDPGVRGDTATGGTKPATLETGAVVQVPLFVNKGEVIRVDTRTSAYLERVS